MISIWTILGILLLVTIVFGYMYQKDRQEQESLEQYLQLDDDQLPLAERKKISTEATRFEQWLLQLDIAQEAFEELQTEMHHKVVGMDEFLHSLFVTLLVGWHVLVEWVPGLAKTRTIATLAQTLDLSFRRLQFTPDMLPGDITGIEIYNPKTQQFDITEWPIFANIILADEINRTTPKVQSALLEAMQEQQVTIGGETKKLPQPFFVLATQNPLEQEGTYPLPEAQVDRFLFHILVDYPSQEEEKKILDMHELQDSYEIKKVMSVTKLKQYQKLASEVPMTNKLKDYIIKLVASTREATDLFAYGASPRASIALMQSARAVAFLSGRKTVKIEDIQAVALPVMRHRVILRYEAKAQGYTPDMALLEVLGKVCL